MWQTVWPEMTSTEIALLWEPHWKWGRKQSYFSQWHQVTKCRRSTITSGMLLRPLVNLGASSQQKGGKRLAEIGKLRATKRAVVNMNFSKEQDLALWGLLGDTDKRSQLPRPFQGRAASASSPGSLLTVRTPGPLPQLSSRAPRVIRVITKAWEAQCDSITVMAWKQQETFRCI